MRRDPLAWAALGAAVVVTASAEYELARACGFNQWVAAGVPAALDVYAVRALRARRDVLAVVAAMIAVNAASHLVSAGLLPVNVPLVVAVSAIAPLVMWRVHALRENLAEAGQTSSLKEASSAPEPARPDAELTAPGVPVLGEFSPLPPLPPGFPPAVTPDTSEGITRTAAAVPAAQPRRVVTEVVTGPEPGGHQGDHRHDHSGDQPMTAAELRTAARHLNRQAVKDTGRPVTIDQLRAGLGLSRRAAAALRRDVLRRTGRR